MNLSKNLTLKEATKSQTAVRKGINNQPGDKELKALELIAKEVFQPVREYIGKPLAVTSGYRSPELNVAIGGSSTSQHCKGEALDIDGDPFGVSNRAIFNYIMVNLDYDQLIWEFGNDDSPAWVHVSYKEEGNRNEILKASRKGGRVIYEHYGSSQL